MAQWRYVGCNNNYWFWSNGVDAAQCNNAPAEEIEEFPHPHAEVFYGEIQNTYHGDMMAFFNDLNIMRETLADMRARNNIW